MCATLPAPPNGNISECGVEYGSQCEFSCDAGHRLVGQRTSHCQANGWTSGTPFCDPCPDNFYLKSEQLCMPCPKYSTTNGALGVSRETCQCQEGYAKNEMGFCDDVDGEHYHMFRINSEHNVRHLPI